MKTAIEQIAPLTDAAREVLDEIRADRGKVEKPADLVFTRNGERITKDMVQSAMDAARTKAGVRDFRFHDYRHAAKTRWAKASLSSDIAMKAAGHSSVEMHQRYVHLQRSDIGQAFGTARDRGQSVAIRKSK